MMNLTADEKKTVKAVFAGLLALSYDEANKIIGSITIEEMSKLYEKLYMEDYCEKHGKDFEELTTQDYIDEYEERCNEYHSEYEED